MAIRNREARTPIAVIAFLLLFAILITIVSHVYLIPAIAAAKDANPKEKAQLMAYSRLLLFLVLFILFVALLLTFRVGRFFFPRPTQPRVRTKYVDAWAEAGNRLESQPTEEADDDDQSAV